MAGENKQGKIGIIYVFTRNLVQHPFLIIFSVVIQNGVSQGILKEEVQSELWVVHGLTRMHRLTRNHEAFKCTIFHAQHPQYAFISRSHKCNISLVQV